MKKSSICFRCPESMDLVVILALDVCHDCKLKMMPFQKSSPLFNVEGTSDNG